MIYTWLQINLLFSRLFKIARWIVSSCNKFMLWHAHVNEDGLERKRSAFFWHGDASPVLCVIHLQWSWLWININFDIWTFKINFISLFASEIFSYCDKLYQLNKNDNDNGSDNDYQLNFIITRIFLVWWSEKVARNSS